MAQALRVIQLLPALNNGGVERGTVEIANYLAAQGHTSIVISATGKMQQKLSNKVEHIELNIGRKSLFTLNKIKVLRQIFMHKQADIVHARSRLPAWLAYRAITKIRTKKPKFITTVHGLYSVKKYSSIMARGDRVISVSQTAHDYVKQHYSRYLKHEPHLIYRGIDSQEFSYGHTPEARWLENFHAQNPALNGHKLVLLPGRLTSIKGAKELLLWLQKTTHKVKLLLTATTDTDVYSQHLFDWFTQHGVADKIAWIGVQSHMADLYAAVDMVLNTSIRAESFGRTVAESLAIGTPVVAYAHGGVAEILKQIFPQGLVTLNQQQLLANHIDKLLHKPVTVPNQQPFVLAKMLQSTLAIYQDVLNED